MNAAQRRSLNDSRPEPLFVDGQAVWLDAITKKRLDQRSDGAKRSTDICVKVDMSKPLTLERCQSLLHKVGGGKQLAVKIERYFDRQTGLTELDETEEVDKEALSEGYYITISKNFRYYADTNTLQIWEEGYPIYENANGLISKDREALTDCLM